MGGGRLHVGAAAVRGLRAAREAGGCENCGRNSHRARFFPPQIATPEFLLIRRPVGYQARAQRGTGLPRARTKIPSERTVYNVGHGRRWRNHHCRISVGERFVSQFLLPEDLWRKILDASEGLL